MVLTTIGCNNRQSGNNLESVAMEIDKVEKESLPDSTSLYLLVGTYTSGSSEGLYIYRFDTITGKSEYKSLTRISNPSFLTVSNDEKFVYTVSENDDETAAANAFSVNKKEGKLELLNSQPTGGAAPCYITADSERVHVITANYSGGNLTLFKTKKDGMLNPASQVSNYLGNSIHPERQGKPHLHCIEYSPDGQYLFANDLGTDKIYKYQVNKTGEGNYLQSGTPYAYDIEKGSGPRHLKFHPSGQYMYLLSELLSTITCFSYDMEEGDLERIQTVDIDTEKSDGGAEIGISPDGKFLYASKRLENDGIAIFSINQSNGKLTKVGYQNTALHPRHFIITPNGKYLLVASKDEGKIQVFEIDKRTGLLTDKQEDIKIDSPVCLKFISAQ